MTQSPSSSLSEKTAAAAHQAAEAAHDVTDRALDSAEQALERTQDAVGRTRQVVHSGIARAERSAVRLGHCSDQVIDDLATRAADATACGIQCLADCSKQARQHLCQATQSINDYVVRQPIKSMVIAAAAGALFATLLGGKRSRR